MVSVFHGIVAVIATVVIPSWAHCASFSLWFSFQCSANSASSCSVISSIPKPYPLLGAVTTSVKNLYQKCFYAHRKLRHARPPSPVARASQARHVSAAGPPAESSVSNLLTVAESPSQEPLWWFHHSSVSPCGEVHRNRTGTWLSCAKACSRTAYRTHRPQSPKSHATLSSLPVLRVFQQMGLGSSCHQLLFS